MEDSVTKANNKGIILAVLNRERVCTTRVRTSLGIATPSRMASIIPMTSGIGTIFEEPVLTMEPEVHNDLESKK